MLEWCNKMKAKEKVIFEAPCKICQILNLTTYTGIPVNILCLLLLFIVILRFLCYFLFAITAINVLYMISRHN